MSSTRAEQLTMWNISSRWWRAGSKADISNSEKKGGETALSEAVAFSATLSQFVGPCWDGRFFCRSYAAQQHLCWGSFARSFHHIQGGIVWQSLARAWLLEILVFFFGQLPLSQLLFDSSFPIFCLCSWQPRGRAWHDHCRGLPAHFFFSCVWVILSKMWHVDFVPGFCKDSAIIPPLAQHQEPAFQRCFFLWELLCLAPRSHISTQVLCFLLSGSNLFCSWACGTQLMWPRCHCLPELQLWFVPVCRTTLHRGGLRYPWHTRLQPSISFQTFYWKYVCNLLFELEVSKLSCPSCSAFVLVISLG